MPYSGRRLRLLASDFWTALTQRPPVAILAGQGSSLRAPSIHNTGRSDPSRPRPRSPIGKKVRRRPSRLATHRPLTRSFALEYATSLQKFLDQNEQLEVSEATLRRLKAEKQTAEADIQDALREVKQQTASLRYMHAIIVDAPSPNFVSRPLVERFNERVYTEKRLQREQDTLATLESHLVSGARKVLPRQLSRPTRRRARAEKADDKSLEEDMASLRQQIIEQDDCVNSYKDIASSELRGISRHHGRKAVRQAELFNPVNSVGAERKAAPSQSPITASDDPWEGAAKAPPSLDSCLEDEWEQAKAYLEDKTNNYNQLKDPNGFMEMCEDIEAGGWAASSDDAVLRVLNMRHNYYINLDRAERRFMDVRVRAMVAGYDPVEVDSNLGEFDVHAHDDEDTDDDKPWVGIDERKLQDHVDKVGSWLSQIPSSATSQVSNRSRNETLSLASIRVGDDTNTHTVIMQARIQKDQAQREHMRGQADIDRREFLRSGE